MRLSGAFLSLQGFRIYFYPIAFFVFCFPEFHYFFFFSQLLKTTVSFEHKELKVQQGVRRRSRPLVKQAT